MKSHWKEPWIKPNYNMRWICADGSFVYEWNDRTIRAEKQTREEYDALMAQPEQNPPVIMEAKGVKLPAWVEVDGEERWGLCVDVYGELRYATNTGHVSVCTNSGWRPIHPKPPMSVDEMKKLAMLVGGES